MILTAIGAAAFAIAAFALVARYLPLTNLVLVVAAAMYPVSMVGTATALILFALSGRWIAAGVAAALFAAMIGVQLPYYLRDRNRPAPGATNVRVMSANLRLGMAIPESVVAAAEQHADIVAVQELTPELAKDLKALDKAFPHKMLDPREHAAGVGLWSRFPLDEASQLHGYQMPVLTARIRLSGTSTDPTVVVVHLPAPFPKLVRLWRSDVERLAGHMREFAQTAGAAPVIVAGDMNATNDMSDFRRLLRNGYRDAAAQAGAGMKPTFPSDSLVPPIVGLDHILTFQAHVASVRTVRIARSDHLALVAEITFTRSVILVDDECRDRDH